MDASLQIFLEPVGRWFERRLGTPTPPQAGGWPVIARGESALILAPTGSGKTLAAFLLAIDRVARAKLAAGPEPSYEKTWPRRGTRGHGSGGVKILYVSPLKSLVNDMEKNLRRPLAQIGEETRRLTEEGGGQTDAWFSWEQSISVGLRTGDTPAKVRAALVRRPPDILLTTPESLNLMLNSQARATLARVQYVIVDEVHALAANKRGVFLSLLLERLEHLRKYAEAAAGESKESGGRRQNAPVKDAAEAENDPPAGPLIRIGLSATARPAEAIARWLGGLDENGVPRPVRIVDTQQRKRLDVQVICPWGGAAEEDRWAAAREAAGGPRAAPANLLEDKERSHWPAVARVLSQLIRAHRGTLVFANSRRLVERIVQMLHEQEIAGDMILPGAGMLRTLKILPHHGSISKEVRLATETALKNGELDAVITTSSLELGIDIGMLDLVVQIDSPGTVAAALQRVGRAGHLEKATAKGRLIPRMAADLPALAALVPQMLAGGMGIEPVQPISNALDVLAQQIAAACVALPEGWERQALYRLVKQSSAYAGLSEELFDRVLAMLAPNRSWEKQFVEAGVRSPIRPRISWDRVHDRLMALPGTAHVVATAGGVISDTGQFAVYVMGPGAAGRTERQVRLGELDEEFVYETKEGDRIVLGAQLWTVERIEADRVLVLPFKAGGAPRGMARLPFWKGETAPRSVELGRAIAELLEELERRAATSPEEARQWLIVDHCCDANAADELLSLRARQRGAGSCLPHAHRIVVEHFVDQSGAPMIAVLSPLGGRVHQTLHLALATALRQRGAGAGAQIIHTDDGLLIRALPDALEDLGPVLNLLRPETLEQEVRAALEDSALFGLRFRQNAGRALLLPRPNPQKRTPLWQQRLRAKHLLALVKTQPNFPMVIETYREILQDTLDLAGARRLLEQVALGAPAGGIEVKVCQTNGPSPLVKTLWWSFEQVFLYQWDEPMGSARGGGGEPSVAPEVLDAALGQTGDKGSGSVRVRWTAADRATLQRRVSGADLPAREAEELLEKIAWAGPVEAGKPDDPNWQAWATVDPEPLLEALLTARRLVLVRWPARRAVRGRAKAQEYRWLATENLALVARALEKTEEAENHDPPPLDLATFARSARASGKGAWRRVALDPYELPPALLEYEAAPAEARRTLVVGTLQRRVGTTVEELCRSFEFMRADIPEIVKEMRTRRALLALPAESLAPEVAAALEFGPKVNEPRAAFLILPEYADQLQLLALRRTRQETPTADLAALQRHLLTWHRLTPRGGASEESANDAASAASGTLGGGLEAAAALQCSLDMLWPLAFSLPVWIHGVLPPRVMQAGERIDVTRLLNDAVATGHWIPVGTSAESAGEIMFLPRPEVVRRQVGAPPVGLLEQGIVDYLQRHGASYRLDLLVSLQADDMALAQALRELFFAGRISNDQLPTIAALDRQIAPAEGRPEASGRATAAEAWRQGRYPPGLGAAGSDLRGRGRPGRGGGMHGSDAALGGRWYVLPPPVEDGKATPLETAAQMAARAERLLVRHGVACRELSQPVVDGPWREAYQVLTRLEWAGQVRRGYFVEGLAGIQFLVPQVRLAAASWSTPPGGVVWLSMLDPANIYAAAEHPWEGSGSGGGAVPAPRLARAAGNFLALTAAGPPVLAASSWGQTLTALTADPALLDVAVAALGQLLERLPPERPGLLVRQWVPAAEPGRGGANAARAIVGSPAEPALRRAGFTRDTHGLRLYRAYHL